MTVGRAKVTLEPYLSQLGYILGLLRNPRVCEYLSHFAVFASLGGSGGVKAL